MASWNMVSIGSANDSSLIRRRVVIITDVDLSHYDDVIMSAMASQITSLTIVYSSVYSGADQGKYQSSASLAFVRGIHRWPVNSPHEGPVTRKMFPSDDVIMINWTPTYTFQSNLIQIQQLHFVPASMYGSILNFEFENYTFQITAPSGVKSPDGEWYTSIVTGI